MSIQVPVLIVGAGPTGLTAAIVLKQLGIDCLVIDKLETPIKTSNALGIQPRTLELFEKLGIIDEALKQGHPLYGLNIYENKQKIAHLSIKNLKTPFPYILGLPQFETEKILSNRFIGNGGKIERGLELITIEQDPNEVTVVCEKENKEKIILKAKWVLACDGSKSLIRELLEIPFRGKDLLKHFIMADLPATGIFNPNEVHTILSSEGVLVLLPLKSFYRIILDVTQQKELTKLKSPDIKVLRELVKKRCAFPITLGEPFWSSNFWVHEHIANKYYKNRIFLLGDAAHEHSPVGGQGMNMGIQDAYNLAWKLAMVETHQIERFYLNSYELERRPIAKKIVRGTTEMTNIFTLSSPFLQSIRSYIFKSITNIRWIQRKLGETVAQLNIQYPKSDFIYETGSSHKGVTPGKQMPYSPITFEKQTTHLAKIIAKNKFTLIVFSGLDGANSSKLIDFLGSLNQKELNIECYAILKSEISLDNIKQIIDKNDIIHHQYGALNACFYLVRPDQYIAYRSASLDKNNLKFYLDKIGIIPKLL